MLAGDVTAGVEVPTGDSTDPVTAAPAAEVMSIGTNVQGVFDWAGAWMFTDVFKQSRDWIPHEINTTTGEFVWEGDSTVHANEHGWPTQLGQWTNADGHVVRQLLGTLMFHDLDGRYPAGVYRAEWDGNGSIASGAVHFDSDGTVVLNHGVTAEGRNFADVQVTPDDWGIHLIIAQIDAADPIRNINIWMPDYEGQSFASQRDWAPGADFSPFHPLFVARLQPFGTLRMMQLAGACDTSEVHWADRRELTHARQSQTDRLTSGTALEYQIELANQLQADAWFNMPHTAGDEYVWNYATMVRDAVDPGLTIYVEWSNEPFNDRPEYPAYHWVTEQLALPENAGRDRWEFTASEIRRDMAIWSDVFAGQEERLVRVVSGFTHVPDVAEQMLSHMNGEFDALAVGAYVQPDAEERELYTSATTADQVLDDTIGSMATTLGYIDTHRAMLEQYEQDLGRDLGFLLYEGGTHLDVDRTPVPETFAAAFADERLYDIEELLLNGTHDVGVDLFTDFQYTERWNDGVGFHATLGGNFGSLLYQDQPLEEAHKYRALIDAIDGAIIDVNNQRPTISEISDITMSAGETIDIGFTVGDAETPADQLIFLADASESALVPNSNIEITGSGTGRTLSFTTEQSEIPRAMVSLLVVDANGGTALETFEITIVPGGDPPPSDENTPPTALDATRTALEDDEAWIELWQLADDAETPFEQLQFTFSNVVGGMVERFDVWNAIFTPDANYDGPASFDYTVTDMGDPASSASATVDIQITPVNDWPTAGHLAITTNEDTPVEFSLASVVSDVETPDEQLNVTFPNVWGGTLVPTGQPLTYRFTPEPDDYGTVELWYQVVDEGGLEDWDRVTIEVLPVNDAPVAEDASYVTHEGWPFWIDLWQLVGDAETPLEQLDITFSNVVGGMVERIGPYTLVFTPLDGFIGTAGFDYQVSDSGTPPLSTAAAVDIAIMSLAESDSLWSDCELQLC